VARDQRQHQRLAVERGDLLLRLASEPACQKAAVLRATSRWPGCSSQAFHRITTQLRHGHREQQDRHHLGDRVALAEQFDEAHAAPAPSRGRAHAAAQHVEHVEQALLLAGQEAHGAQAALGVGRAAGRLVGDLDALAGAGEQHGVVADDVAAADGGKPMAGGFASPVTPSRA
jgi:hypothetical protein